MQSISFSTFVPPHHVMYAPCLQICYSSAGTPNSSSNTQEGAVCPGRSHTDGGSNQVSCPMQEHITIPFSKQANHRNMVLLGDTKVGNVLQTLGRNEMGGRGCSPIALSGTPMPRTFRVPWMKPGRSATPPSGKVSKRTRSAYRFPLK